MSDPKSSTPKEAPGGQSADQLRPPCDEADRRIQLLLASQASLQREMDRLRDVREQRPSRNWTSALAAVVTHAWKARMKLVASDSGQPLEPTRRIYWHMESIFDAFQTMGLVVQDHTDEPFDYGLPWTVVTTQPTPGLIKEQVLETIKPTIYWNDRVIQIAEVVIATPIHPESP